ncbi:MAG: PEP-CTERM sorting domain-containing protein [Colwellia sp.]|nr:PEP-CTERM sorting domain-containing protein [Colwellia sp.]
MKCLKWIAAITLSISSLSSFAANIPATTIADNYIGAGYNGDVNGGNRYWDIANMTVSRDSNGIMTVDILTSFYNDIGKSGIVLGDLFMSTDIGANGTPWNPTGTSGSNYSDDRFAENGGNTGTNWNYAYNIDQGERGNIWYTNGNYKYANGSGTGRLVDNFGSDDLVHSNANNGHRANQAVYLGAGSGDTINNSGGWSNEGFTTQDGSWYGTLSFSFDTTGTALETANQIAFRWAMSCANDIIEGLVSISNGGGGGGTTVPEPQTILLMLLGLAGITYRRKQKGFSA